MSDVEALSGRDDIIIVLDLAERKAKVVGDLLRQTLPSGDQMRSDLEEVVAVLAVLHAQLTEWVELHCLIHDMLTALAPFHALLASVGGSALGVMERQALLQGWRLCQRCVDALVDFAEGLGYIGRPFRREGRELEGERWAVDIISLQALIEDELKEKDIDPGSLLEMVEELDSACHCHLAVADLGLRMTAGGLRRLDTSLLGGLE
jgi:hypothetical protein